MSDWQPIETAPRDGTDVLLLYRIWNRPRMIVAGWFEDAFYPFEKDEWPVPRPTHWMPLPAAPLEA